MIQQSLEFGYKEINQSFNRSWFLPTEIVKQFIKSCLNELIRTSLVKLLTDVFFYSILLIENCKPSYSEPVLLSSRDLVSGEEVLILGVVLLSEYTVSTHFEI
jgi:hypothetical protein